MRKGMIAFLAVVVVAGCGSPREITSTVNSSFGNASLVSGYTADEQEALAHLLFIPQWEPPGDGEHGRGVGSEQTRDRWTFTANYFDDQRRITAQPVTVIEQTRVEAGGRSFAIADGNLFVVHVSESGDVSLTQLRRTLRNGPELDRLAILREYKAAAPNDARVQALPET